jgi:tetratricopeptide (TPR) repeat protein
MFRNLMSMIVSMVLIAQPAVAAQRSSSLRSLETELEKATGKAECDVKHVALIRHALGHAYEFASRNDAAISQWQAALSVYDKASPADREAACVVFDLASLLQRQQQFAEAAALWEREIELLKVSNDRRDRTRSAFANEQLARAYIALKDYKRAETVLRRMLTNGSDSNIARADLYLLLGETMNGLKRYKDAKAAFETALQLANDKATIARAHLGSANAGLMANESEQQVESELQLALNLAQRCQDDTVLRDAVEDMGAFYKLFGRQTELEALRNKFKDAFTTVITGQNAINNRYSCGCDSHYRSSR